MINWFLIAKLLPVFICFKQYTVQYNTVKYKTMNYALHETMTFKNKNNKS